MQDFLNPYDVIERHGLALPHWQQGSTCVFVTWRLADALPAAKLRDWKNERALWFETHPLPWDRSTWEEYNERFPKRMEAWLDRGMGACLLREPETRQILADALHFFDAQRYHLRSYVIMPNHVHVLFQPHSGYELAAILHSWKSYTAKRVRKRVGGAGDVWQRGYWDRLIRNQQHLDRCEQYIRKNPEIAGLASKTYSYYSAEKE